MKRPYITSSARLVTEQTGNSDAREEIHEIKEERWPRISRTSGRPSETPSVTSRGRPSRASQATDGRGWATETAPCPALEEWRPVQPWPQQHRSSRKERARS